MAKNVDTPKMIKMKERIKALQEEALVDCTFDKGMLETQFDNTKTTMKWIAKKQEYSDLLRQFEYNRKVTYAKLHMVYKTESTLKINTKAELDIFIDVDAQYIEDNALMIMCKDAVTMIGEILAAVKDKNFEIKRYLEYLQFINGK